MSENNLIEPSTTDERRVAGCYVPVGIPHGKPVVVRRILDLFCGAGGAAMGLNRAFPEAEIVGVDIKEQPRYPFTFVRGDAMEYPLDGFDFVWASPPCQAYVDPNANGRKASKHPRLIEPTRERLKSAGVWWVIENIDGSPLKAGAMLCGTMFGLRVLRHRYFESNFPFPFPMGCNHWGTVASGEFIGVYARGGKGHRHGRGVRDAKPKPPKVSASEAMGIHWMTETELRQAIPPSYGEWVGKACRAIISTNGT